MVNSHQDAKSGQHAQRVTAIFHQLCFYANFRCFYATFRRFNANLRHFFVKKKLPEAKSALVSIITLLACLNSDPIFLLLTRFVVVNIESKERVGQGKVLKKFRFPIIYENHIPKSLF